MTRIVNFLRAIFVEPPCAGCNARDYHIASLKQEIHELREFYEREVCVQHDDMHDIVKHLTGMNRVANQSVDTKLHSIPRTSGIHDRIKRAEQKESDPILAEQRKKEYEARIEALINPKPEVVVESAV